MKTTRLQIILAGSMLAFACPAIAGDHEQQPEKSQPRGEAAVASIDTLLAGWPERPQLGARQMIAKYGDPQETTDHQLVWHDQGPYKRITVTKAEDHHDFPLPHMDYMEHTISYKVPADKADELMKFDGSVTFDRTRGEMSARCDLEGHNNLTLNLAHDIVTGKSDAEEARVTFGKTVAEDMAGKYPPYTTKLQFEPAEMTKDSDKPTIPGAPVRAMKAEGDADKEVAAKSKTGGDAEILSILLAVDTNEVVAAMEAAKKKLSPAISDYAQMLHEAHGKHAATTMKIGKEIEVTPLDTTKTNEIRTKGAGQLATLVSLDDDKFGAAYLDAIITGHTEVIAMIDGELIKTAENDALKKHLAETRDHLAMHLEKAKEIQALAKN